MKAFAAEIIPLLLLGCICLAAGIYLSHCLTSNTCM